MGSVKSKLSMVLDLAEVEYRYGKQAFIWAAVAAYIKKLMRLKIEIIQKMWTEQIKECGND